MEKYALLIGIYIILNIGLSILILSEICGGNAEPFEFSASNLYYNSKMNMFGCIICSVIIMFFTSVYHIPAFYLLDCVQVISHRKEKIIWQGILDLNLD